MPAQTDESAQKREIRAFTLEQRVTTPGGKATYFLTLPINPQSLTIAHPSRAMPQQTLGGQYVEEWGGGFPAITLDGHTGYAPRAAVEGLEAQDGYQAFQELVTMMRRYFDLTVKKAKTVGAGSPLVLLGAADEAKVEMILHYWEEDEHWYVVPTGNDALRRSRNSGSPLLFNYTLSLTAVGKAEVSPELAGMLGLPSVDNLLGGLLANLGGFGEALGAFGNLIGGLATTFMAGVAAVADTVGKIAKGATSLINTVMGPIRNLIKQGRAMMGSINRAVAGVVAARNAALRALRDLRALVCGLAHLGKALQKAFAPLFAGWDQFGKLLQRC